MAAVATPHRRRQDTRKRAAMGDANLAADEAQRQPYRRRTASIAASGGIQRTTRLDQRQTMHLPSQGSQLVPQRIAIMLTALAPRMPTSPAIARTVGQALWPVSFERQALPAARPIPQRNPTPARAHRLPRRPGAIRRAWRARLAMGGREDQPEAQAAWLSALPERARRVVGIGKCLPDAGTPAASPRPARAASPPIRRSAREPVEIPAPTTAPAR